MSWVGGPRKLLDGGWLSEKPRQDERAGTFSPTHYPPGSGEGWDIELIIMPTWWIFHKIPQPKAWGELLSRWTHPCARRMAHPKLHRDRSSYAGDPSIPLSSSGCCSFVILYNKLVNMFPWVLWAILSKLLNWRGLWEPLIYIAGWSEWQVTCDWHLSGGGAALWEWDLNLQDLCSPDAVSVRTELNCQTP